MFTLSKLIGLAIILVFGSIGYNFLPDLFIYLFPQITWTHTSIFSIIVGILIGFIASLLISKPIEKAIRQLQEYVSTLNASYILFGTVGAILGLVVAWLINLSLFAFSTPIISDVVPIILTVLFVDGARFPKDVALVVGVPPGKAPIILHSSLLNHT